MEQNNPVFNKQTVPTILNKIAKNRKYSSSLPPAPPKQADEEAFQNLMNNSPEQTEGPGPQPFQNLLNQEPPTPQEEEDDV